MLQEVIEKSEKGNAMKYQIDTLIIIIFF